MMEERLNNSLVNTGYTRMDSNAQGIYLFYRVQENELIIVSILRAISGNEITTEQYEHILSQIKTNFQRSYPYRKKLLSIIITSNPDQVKYLATSAKEDSHWIIDLYANRLIIYETQEDSFANIQRDIEQLLMEEETQQNVTHQNTYSSVQGARNRYKLSPVTMSIIATNIVVYLFTHFTGAFGGSDVMLEKGALSWYYITVNNEFYRILTSIFLHADWSHLVNNMIVLLFVGGNLERAIGKVKYLIIYFATGILAGIASISYNMWHEYGNTLSDFITFSIGASGAIFGIVGATLIIVILNRGRLQEISTRQMIIFVVLSLYSGVVNAQIDQAAHIGGFITGLILALLLYRRRKRNITQM